MRSREYFRDWISDVPAKITRTSCRRCDCCVILEHGVTQDENVCLSFLSSCFMHREYKSRADKYCDAIGMSVRVFEIRGHNEISIGISRKIGDRSITKFYREELFNRLSLLIALKLRSHEGERKDASIESESSSRSVSCKLGCLCWCNNLRSMSVSR